MSGAGNSPGNADRRRTAELIAAASIEISPRDELAGAGLGELFRSGTTVFVNHPGSVTHHDIVGACARLRASGFNPVPHVAARRLLSFTQAADFLRRAKGEAGVDEVLLVGGDPDRPAGPFRDAQSLLASGLVERNGIACVVFAGYPEGHPRIAAKALASALCEKIALAGRLGLETRLVTQFGFEAQPILGWIRTLRDDGFACPVRVGLAGPASVATLAKFALRCGIGASLSALTRGRQAAAFARILAEADPAALIDALVAGEDPASPLDGLHLFTFGGVRRTARWLNAAG